MESSDNEYSESEHETDPEEIKQYLEEVKCERQKRDERVKIRKDYDEAITGAKLEHEMIVDSLDTTDMKRRSLPVATEYLEAVTDTLERLKLWTSTTLVDTNATLKRCAELLHSWTMSKEFDQSCTQERHQRVTELAVNLKAEIRDEVALVESTTLLADEFRGLGELITAADGTDKLVAILHEKIPAAEAQLEVLMMKSNRALSRNSSRNTSRKYVHRDTIHLCSLASLLDDWKKKILSELHRHSDLFEMRRDRKMNASRLSNIANRPPILSKSLHLLDDLEKHLADFSIREYRSTSEQIKYLKDTLLVIDDSIIPSLESTIFLIADTTAEKKAMENVLQRARAFSAILPQAVEDKKLADIEFHLSKFVSRIDAILVPYDDGPQEFSIAKDDFFSIERIRYDLANDYDFKAPDPSIMETIDDLKKKMDEEINDEYLLLEATYNVASEISLIEKVIQAHDKSRIEMIRTDQFPAIDAQLDALKLKGETAKNAPRKFVARDTAELSRVVRQLKDTIERHKNYFAEYLKKVQENEGLLRSIAQQLQQLAEAPINSFDFTKLDVLENQLRNIHLYVPESANQLDVITMLREKLLDTFKSEFRIKFHPVSIIGQGFFGSVFEAKLKLIDQAYAIKRIPLKDNDDDTKKALQEAKSLAKFVHPGIVRFHNSWLEKTPPGWQRDYDACLMKKFGICEQDNKNIITYGDLSMFLYIQMEHCKSNLSEWLNENRERDPNRIKSWFKQIVSAVDYIHKQNTMHRDLKPSNILVVSDEVVKICDLGIATTIKREESGPLTLRTDIGTHFYKAPEQLTGFPIYDERVDIFAMGLILLELAVSMTDEERSKYFCYIRCAIKLPILQEQQTTVNLITWLTRLDKDQRPSQVEEILKHPFFSDKPSGRTLLSRVFGPSG